MQVILDLSTLLSVTFLSSLYIVCRYLIRHVINRRRLR